MATRIRLQRHGKKNKAFFHLVVADSRAKRDGKFIEKLGVYNPNTNPATIDIDFDSTLNWVRTGAEMSETARAILSYKGILYKNHLINGIKKGALTEEQLMLRYHALLFARLLARFAPQQEGLDPQSLRQELRVGGGSLRRDQLITFAVHPRRFAHPGDSSVP